jgi:hypothetical protein
MTWEYRVMQRGEEFQIFEVYYCDDGSVRGYSSEPVMLCGDSLEELKENCELFSKAVLKPVLIYVE